jgi:phenylpropionate dioxygenase-like ring-hydroxylating dioxygenase large terminal subunit
VSVETTLPFSWYTDEDILRREQQRIFRRSWQYAGRADQVSQPGSYMATWTGEVPVVVTRADDGEVRAFANVCRHRGSVLVEDEGRRATIQCPYHAWTYGLDGQLRAAPRSDREEAFDREELSLVPMRLEAWGPLLFVTADPEPSPLAEALGEVPTLLAEAGIDMSELRFHRRVEYEVECNWKIACENYLECYHCPVAHPGFSKVVDVSPDAYRLQTGRLTSSQFGPLRDGTAEGQFHFVWPNLKVYSYPGPPNLAVGPVAPRGPERSAGFLDYFFGEDADETAVQELLGLDDQVGREDAALIERVQRGVRSGVLYEGRLLSDAEQLIGHFDRLVAEALV